MKHLLLLALAFLALESNAQKNIATKTTKLDVKIIEIKDKYTKELSYSVDKSIISSKGSRSVEIEPNFYGDEIVGIQVYAKKKLREL